MNIQSRIALVKKSILHMEEYLALKMEFRDWHGVADAAMDLRELEAELKVLQSMAAKITTVHVSDSRVAIEER